MTAVMLASLKCDAPRCDRWRLATSEDQTFRDIAEEAGFLHTPEHGWLCSVHAEEYEHSLPFSDDKDMW